MGLVIRVGGGTGCVTYRLRRGRSVPVSSVKAAPWFDRLVNRFPTLFLRTLTSNPTPVRPTRDRNSRHRPWRSRGRRGGRNASLTAGRWLERPPSIFAAPEYWRHGLCHPKIFAT